MSSIPRIGSPSYPYRVKAEVKEEDVQDLAKMGPKPRFYVSEVIKQWLLFGINLLILLGFPILLGIESDWCKPSATGFQNGVIGSTIGAGLTCMILLIMRGFGIASAVDKRNRK